MKRTTLAVVALLLGSFIGVQVLGAAQSNPATREKPLKLGIVITQADPETVWNAFRLANYSLGEKEEVGVFLLGKGVELDRIQDATFNVRELAESFLKAGGRIMACGTCLKLRNSKGSTLCPLSTLKDLHALIKDSDRVVTF